MKDVPEQPAVPIHARAVKTDIARQLDELRSQVARYRTELAEQSRALEETRADLDETYKRYNNLYNLSPVGFLTLDRKGRITELNERAARMLGFSASWLVMRPFMAFLARSSVRRFLSLLMGSLSQPEAETINLELSLGAHNTPVQVSVRTTLDGRNLVHQMTLVDLTDTKKAEKQLHYVIGNWSALVQNAPDVIMTLDRHGKITFVNRPIWGCSVTALLGTRLVDHVVKEHRPKLQECIRQIFRSPRRTTCEVAATNTGAEAWFSVICGPSSRQAAAMRSTVDGEAPPDAATVLIRDITENKRTEQTLRDNAKRLRELAARVEAIREEERMQIAREIHDELGQALTILKLDLSWTRQKIPRAQKDERKRLTAMMHHVDGTIERVRKISSALRPPILDDLGLAAALEWQLTEFQKRSRIRCQFDADVEKFALTPAASAAVFRVVQEALTNVVRHARASNVQVRVGAAGDALEIAIIDNGKGITQQLVDSQESLGIIGMRERISRIGGQFKIGPRPGGGTAVEITMPMKND
jgi:PAS domain S-box-containing protein